MTANAAPVTDFNASSSLERLFVDLAQTQDMEPRRIGAGLFQAIPAELMSPAALWSTTRSIAVTTYEAEDLSKLAELATLTGWFTIAQQQGGKGNALVFTPNWKNLGIAASEGNFAEDCSSRALMSMRAMVQTNDVFEAFAEDDANVIVNAYEIKDLPEIVPVSRPSRRPRA